MLIEKLSKNDIEQFVKAELGMNVYSCDFDDVRGYIVNVSNSANKKERDIVATIVLKDFNVTHQLQNVDSEELKHNWICFLYAKLGEEYKEAYNQNLKQKYEEEIIR